MRVRFHANRCAKKLTKIKEETAMYPSYSHPHQCRWSWYANRDPNSLRLPTPSTYKSNQKCDHDHSKIVPLVSKPSKKDMPPKKRTKKRTPVDLDILYWDIEPRQYVETLGLEKIDVEIHIKIVNNRDLEGSLMRQLSGRCVGLTGSRRTSTRKYIISYQKKNSTL